MSGKLFCLVGRHAWTQQVNHEVSGPDAVYSVCSRCGKEKAGYGLPTPGAPHRPWSGGLGGAHRGPTE